MDLRAFALFPQFLRRARLRWLVFLLFFPGFVATLAIGYVSYESKRANLIDDTKHIANGLSQVIDMKVQLSAALLQALAASPELERGNFASFHRQARDVIKATHAADAIALVDRSGKTMLDTSRPYGARAPVGDADRARRVFTAGSPQVSDLIPAGTGGRPAIAIDIPVIRNGAAVYGMRMTVAAERVQRRLMEQDLPKSWGAMIVDRDGIIVARTQSPESFVGTRPSASVQAEIARGGDTAGDIVTREGFPMIAAFSRSPFTGYTTVVFFPPDVLVGDLLGFFAVTVGVISILVLFGVGVVWWFGDFLLRPIRALTAAAVAAESGQLDVELPTDGPAEVADLAGQFNRMTRSLRRDFDFVRKVIDTAPSLIFVKDREGRYVLGNEALAQLYRTTEQDLIGRTDADFNPVATETGHYVSDDLEVMDTRRAKYIAEESVTGVDGSVRWFATVKVPLTETDGRCDKVLGVATDITERKRAEAALQDALKRLEHERNLLQAVMNGAKGFYLVYLDRDFNFVRVNESYARTCGFSPEEMIGKNHFALYPHAENEAIFRQVRDTGEPVEFHDKPFEFPDFPERGVTYWDWVLSAVKDESGHVVGLVFALIETTVRKRAELALQEANERKDEFLAQLGHELRNPLAPIRNAAHVLGQLQLSEPRIQWAQEVIEHQVAHLSRLVDDLLDVARIVRGKVLLRKEPIELATIVERALEGALPAIETREQRFSIRLPEAPVWIYGDPARLCQVLLNLLDNASKYTQVGGRIELSGNVADGTLELRVADNGVGISREMLPRVFDMFEQERRTQNTGQGGLGIGLTLVQRLVHMHDGGIRAESDGPGRGACFVLRLPVTAPPLKQGASEQSAPLRCTSRRVLVIDDEPEVADSVAVLLRMEGHDVRVAGSGTDGIELADVFAPQAVLLDIGLKDMDGCEVARRLRGRAAGQDLLIVAITGFGDERTGARALAAGCDRFLVKPVSPGVVVRLLQEVGQPGSAGQRATGSS